MKLKLIVLLVLIGTSLLSMAQTPPNSKAEVEAFKTKLHKYFHKYQRAADSRMPVIKPGTAESDMPTGNLQSQMIDNELGLTYEFSTNKIFDQATALVYNMQSEMIYDADSNDFFEFKMPGREETEFFYYRKLVPHRNISYHSGGIK